MFRISAFLAATMLVCASAQAATPVNTTMTVTASTGAINLTATSIPITGTVTFNPGIPATTGTFSASTSLTAIESATGATVPIPYTITVSGGTVLGTINVPTVLLLGQSTTTPGSASVTGGTGSYAGSTGNFPSVTGTSTGSLTAGFSFTFSGAGSITVGGGGTTTPTPTITKVVDNAGYTANIAQGSIFAVFGSNLCSSGGDGKVYSVPRPTVGTDGVKITFTPTAGGAGTDAYLWYETTGQLGAILPSTVAPGSYNVTVTNGPASAAFAVTVVAHKFSMFTQDQSGSGLASVENVVSTSEGVDLNRFTTGTIPGWIISPAHPGQFLLVYGTGMGPLVGGDNVDSPDYDFSTNGVTVQAIVGGMTVPVAYAGRAGYAGEDQINVALPANVPTGCTVSFQISVNGTLSNPTFISIAPDVNSNACVAPGFTTTQLQNFDNGATYTVGGFSVLNYAETVQGTNYTYGAAAGGFTRYTGFQLSGAATANVTSLTSGSCTVTTVTSSTSTVTTTGSGTELDAGALTITGPAGSNLSNTAMTETDNLYSINITNLPFLTGGVNGSVVAGTYTIKGAGGKDVGPFSAQVSIGAPLVVTGGLPTTVARGNGLTLNWTGGNSSDFLEIVGSASTGSGDVFTSTTFICTTTAGAKTFTVPPTILNQLPASSTGSLTVGSGAFTSFMAPLTAGGSIDIGFFTGFTGTAGSAVYQ